MTTAQHECSNGLVSKWWGAAWWSILHSVVRSPIPQRQEFVTLVSEVLPCAPCRVNFKNQLRLRNAFESQRQWLERAHSEASGRPGGGHTQPAVVTPQIVAFVAKCVAINYPTEPDTERASCSSKFLHLLQYTFPGVFRSGATSWTAETRVQMMANVDQALSPPWATPPCSTLEQLRHYSRFDSRVERCSRNARLHALVS